MLEICPTSNLLTKALPDEDAVRDTFRAFVEAGVPFTIATDGPEMMRTHLRDEFELLLRIGALDEEELRAGERPRPRCKLCPGRGAACELNAPLAPRSQLLDPGETGLERRAVTLDLLIEPGRAPAVELEVEGVALLNRGEDVRGEWTRELVRVHLARQEASSRVPTPARR